MNMFAIKKRVTFFKKKVNKKKLCRPTLPNFFGDVSGNKEFFYAL